jgi:hypothetical protein
MDINDKDRRTFEKSIAGKNQNQPKLMDEVRAKFQLLHLGKRTERASVGWIRRYLHFAKTTHGKWVHPVELGNDEINRFLTSLAVEGTSLRAPRIRPYLLCYFFTPKC